MFFYVYRVTNLVNGKIYVGCHRTKNLDDGYMGSGRRLSYAKRKYGVENFRKEILEFFKTAEEMFAKEKKIVDSEFLMRSDVYNLQPGGGGGFSTWHEENAKEFHIAGAVAANKIRSKRLATKREDMSWLEGFSKKLSLACKGQQNFLGKSHSEETKMKMRKPKNVGQSNPSFGTCWVTNGIKSIKIQKELLENYLERGFVKGRKISPS